MSSPFSRFLAFSLIEVSIALGVAAFCLLAVAGLLAVGSDTRRSSTSQTAATDIIAAVVADLRATPKTSGTSSQFKITFGTSKTLYFDAGGQAAGSLTPTSPTPFQPRYRMNITFPSTAALTYASLKVTWPAMIDPATTTPAGSATMFAAFDRN